ncbi:Y-family DNA polymerase [Streptococcus pluranimalium]|uniref:Y-family DNA polymerase n=1 Tax=Streptococcus pluranimalium TaxID=82348 RepID=UPI0039E8E8DB
MGYFDYSKEPISDIAFIDMKSFYASVECVARGLHPLRTSLCVMSHAANSKGLILAASPIFKKVFGKSNIGRSYDLPFDVTTRRFSYENAKRLNLPTNPAYVRFIEAWARATIIVPPRMDEYIKQNMLIQDIFKNYASPDDILPYSIDEGFIDLTSSLNYFIKNHTLARKDKLDMLSAQIQRDVWKNTGIYATIGMSNSNPLLAKLALDNEAKHTTTMRANWSYEDVEDKVWGISQMTDFWGIGRRMEKRLYLLGICSIKELANANPDLLKKELGYKGLELFFHANGIDESNVHNPYKPKSSSIGNSQVLPKDYHRQEDIELVLSEMAEQVAIRLRRKQYHTSLVSLYVGYSKTDQHKNIHTQISIDPTHRTKALIGTVLYLFRKHYQGGAVRNIGISYGKLSNDSSRSMSLFEDFEREEKEEQLEETVDRIRERFGFPSLLPATALLEASRSIERSRLVGGHSAGGLDGLS